MIIYLIVLHFIADFLLQSREMGKKKSTDIVWLVKHLIIQGFTFSVGLTLLGYYNMSACNFVLYNTIIHGFIDWNIWKAYKYSAAYRMKKNPNHELLMPSKDNPWKYWEDHWFYSTIGFDQLLHMATIVFLCGKYL